MKNLLIGLLALGSVSAFANCDLSIVGNINSERLQLVEKIVQDNGYKVTSSGKSDYTLSVFGYFEKFEGGKCVIVDAQINEVATGHVVHNKHNNTCGIFVAKNWNHRIKKVIKNLPECKN